MRNFLLGCCLSTLFMGCSDAAEESLKTNEIRLTAIHNTALGLGARHGLAWEAKQINRLLKAHATTLDQLFNFNTVMLKNHLVPPVLRVADASLLLMSPSTIRQHDRSIDILKQARFTTTPPTWRTYLIQITHKSDKPDPSLLPKDANEREEWDQAIVEGFKRGAEQSRYIFQQQLARLVQDYTGMVLYHKLRQENIVSSPMVGHASLGITGDKKHLTINDAVTRITNQSDLNLRHESWKASVSSSK